MAKVYAKTSDARTWPPVADMKRVQHHADLCQHFITHWQGEFKLGADYATCRQHMNRWRIRLHACARRLRKGAPINSCHDGYLIKDIA